jgi:hypothetical protein
LGATERRRDNDDNTSTSIPEALARNYALADALHQLLTDYPTKDIAVDTLPILLIQLVGGLTYRFYTRYVLTASGLAPE